MTAHTLTITDPQAHHNAIRLATCRAFIERAQALGYKGKRRDDAALDFLCGAQSALVAIDPNSTTLNGLIFVTATRGFMAITGYVADHTAAAA